MGFQLRARCVAVTWPKLNRLAMELIGDVISWLFRAMMSFVLHALMGCYQAMAGSLCQPETPQMVRYQRLTRTFLATALVLFVAGVALTFSVEAAALGYGLIIVALGLMIAAGFFGNLTEHAARDQSNDSDSFGNK